MNRKTGKDFWGGPTWTVIHTFAATLKPEDAEAFKAFLWSLTRLLPCEVCRKNLIKKLTDHPPDPYLTNNHDAFFYSYFIHDLVNQHITKYHPESPKISPPYDEIKAYYFRALGKECSDCKV